MIRFSFFFGCLILFFNLGHAQEENSGGDWTIDDIIHTEYLGSPVISPDGTKVVWSKRKAVKEEDKFVSDLYLTYLDREKDGSFRTVQLTSGDDNDFSPMFSEDSESLYFLSSREEGKKLWNISLLGGEAKEVHSFDNGLSDLEWLNDSTLILESNDGKSLYEQELKKEKDNTVVVEDSVNWTTSRLYTFGLKDKALRRATLNNFPVSGYAVSDSGAWLVYRQIMSRHYGADANPDPEYYLIDLRSGARTEILEGLQTPGSFTFTPDGNGFYFTAERSSDPEWNGSGITELYFFDLQEKSYAKIDLDWDWGIGGGIQRVGEHLLVELANGPTRKLAFYARTSSGWVRSEPDLGEKNEHVNVLSVAKTGDKVIYEYSTAGKLPKYYIADLNVEGTRLNWSGEKELVRLNEKLHAKSTTRHEVIRWQGYDGDEVSGILYYPTDYEEGKRYPLMLSIHGGPSGVDLDSWRERWSTYPQLLAQRGAFVLKPNYHGSSNHGLAFVESIKKNYYTPELEDITKGIDYLVGRGLVDRDQMGAMGWSNGAILTTMLTVRYPDMFKVAAPGAGDVNWTSDFGTCQFGVSFDQSYFGGAPWDDTENTFYNVDYIEYSPLFEMEKVQTPTIIFHGSEDRAVPRDQGWEYYRALQQIAKAPVRFLWFPGQPHGLQKVTHQKRKMEEELAWIDRFLFDKDDAANPAFKEESPLAMLLKRDKVARHEGLYGTWQAGSLLPEVRAVAKDSIQPGLFEVTNAQFAAFEPGFAYGPGQGNMPARTSFRQAQDYVAWLSEKTGKSYRLPNKKEAGAWHEKAHKAGPKENTLNHWAGYELNPEDAAALREKVDELESSLIREVGQFNPVKIGEAELYDLGGNVSEYALDGTTYGYSAYDYVDPYSLEVKRAPGHTGFRVVMDPDMTLE